MPVVAAYPNRRASGREGLGLRRMPQQPSLPLAETHAEQQVFRAVCGHLRPPPATRSRDAQPDSQVARPLPQLVRPQPQYHVAAATA